jgi:hypothetical protein
MGLFLLKGGGERSSILEEDRQEAVKLRVLYTPSSSSGKMEAIYYYADIK